MKSTTADLIVSNSSKRFHELGLSEEDYRLYESWVSPGVFRLDMAQQRKYLAMFKRLASVLPVTDPIPKTLYRAYTFNKDSDAAIAARNNLSLRLEPKALTSWTGIKDEAIGYLKDRWKQAECVNLLVTAPPKDVVLVIGPKVRRFLTTNPYYHANRFEVIVRGNPIPMLTPKNSVPL